MLCKVLFRYFFSTKHYTFLCSYLQYPSNLCLHFWLLHATLRYSATCHAIGTHMYVHTVLQNGLQISSAKKCLMIRYLSGTEVAQTNYFVCIPCGMWKGKSSFLLELTLTALCPKTNNASQSWPTVQLAVTLQ